MGWFKSKEEEKLEIKIEWLDKFPGSLDEYNSLKKEEHVFMDTGNPMKFVYLDFKQFDSRELLEYLISNGCTGFIRYMPHSSYGWGNCGIPVKRK